MLFLIFGNNHITYYAFILKYLYINHLFIFTYLFTFSFKQPKDLNNYQLKFLNIYLFFLIKNGEKNIKKFRHQQDLNLRSFRNEISSLTP